MGAFRKLKDSQTGGLVALLDVRAAEFTQTIGKAAGRPAELRGVLDAGGMRGSTLLVRVEDVVLRLHGHMAHVSAV